MPEADGRLGPVVLRMNPLHTLLQQSGEQVCTLPEQHDGANPVDRGMGEPIQKSEPWRTDTITHLSCGGIREGELLPPLHQCQGQL